MCTCAASDLLLQTPHNHLGSRNVLYSLQHVLEAHTTIKIPYLSFYLNSARTPTLNNVMLVSTAIANGMLHYKSYVSQKLCNNLEKWLLMGQ